MKLAISNIAWKREDDKALLQGLLETHITSIEIAPTRLIENPYQASDSALRQLMTSYEEIGIKFISMQSILFGETRAIFESKESCQMYLDKFKSILSFAKKMLIPTIVFGSPSIRNINNPIEKTNAFEFFNHLALLAQSSGIQIAVEANPTIYGTNFLNTTQEALDFIRSINQPNLGINLDLGTIIQNHEDLESLLTIETIKHVKHVHISEPFLAPIDQKNKSYHQLLLSTLYHLNYQHFVSIEMKSGPTMDEILSTLKYIKDVANQLGDLNE